jgi:hypothetical protein
MRTSAHSDGGYVWEFRLQMYERQKIKTKTAGECYGYRPMTESLFDQWP